MTPDFTHKSNGNNAVNMKGEQIVQVHCGMRKSIFQGATIGAMDVNRIYWTL